MHLIIVHRLLQNLILPPLNAMILIVIAFFIPIKHRKLKLYLGIVGFIFMYMEATPIFAYNLALTIEPKPFKISTIVPDAIVVLGGGVNSNSYEYPVKSISNTDTLTRLRYAAYLANQFPNATLIVSGGYTGSKYREADIMRDALISMFDIKNPIILENNSVNTNENAKFVAEIIRNYKFKTVLLVTQAFHMKRSIMLFQENHIYPIAAATDYTHNDDAKTKALMFIPNARAQSMMSRTLHEIFGYYLYKINYSIEGETRQFLDYL